MRVRGEAGGAGMSALVRPASPRSRTRYQAHPVGPELRYARRAGEWEYGTAVRAVVAGIGLAAFFLGLPLVGYVVCSVLGIDPNAAIR